MNVILAKLHIECSFIALSGLHCRNRAKPVKLAMLARTVQSDARKKRLVLRFL
jgi:hypothetical protein